MSSMFESAISKRGNLAGVFEYEDGVGYFYLCRVSDDQKTEILDAIHVVSGDVDFDEADIRVEWNSADKRVGLFIKGILWAMFDTTNNTKLGGNYVSGGPSSLALSDFLD